MATKKLESLTAEEIAARLTKLITKLEKLKVAYANSWDNRYGHDYTGPGLVADLNLVLTTGERLNTRYKELTGEMWDHRFFEPKLYGELTTNGFGYHKAY